MEWSIVGLNYVDEQASGRSIGLLNAIPSPVVAILIGICNNNERAVHVYLTEQYSDELTHSAYLVLFLAKYPNKSILIVAIWSRLWRKSI